jgi:hypothetical protein
LEAYKNNSWDFPDGFQGGIAEIMQALKDGKTIKGVKAFGNKLLPVTFLSLLNSTQAPTYSGI